MGPSKLTAFHAKPDATTVRHLEQSSDEKNKPKTVVCGSCGAAVGEHKIRRHRAHKCPNRKLKKTLTAGATSPLSRSTVSPLLTAAHPRQEPECLIAAELAGLQTGTLDFELLPPGSWTAQDLINYYEKNADVWRVRFQDKPFDPDRLEQICSLDPFRCWKGTKGFFGYIVFEFYITSRVVLECPFEGNAAYVLNADWKELVCRSKGEIKSSAEGRYKKVVHRTDWLSRIGAALFRGGVGGRY